MVPSEKYPRTALIVGILLSRAIFVHLSFEKTPLWNWKYASKAHKHTGVCKGRRKLTFTFHDTRQISILSTVLTVGYHILILENFVNPERFLSCISLFGSGSENIPIFLSQTGVACHVHEESHQPALISEQMTGIGFQSTYWGVNEFCPTYQHRTTTKIMDRKMSL